MAFAVVDGFEATGGGEVLKEWPTADVVVRFTSGEHGNRWEWWFDHGARLLRANDGGDLIKEELELLLDATTGAAACGAAGVLSEVTCLGDEDGEHFGLGFEIVVAQ